MLGCKFQIFRTKEVIKVATYRELLLLPNIYIPYIEDMPEYNKYIYILDFEIEDTLALVRQSGIIIEPEIREFLDGSTKPIYVEEHEAKKFTDTIVKRRALNVGDVVTIKQFHRLPLTVKEVTKDKDIHLEHKMNNLAVTMITKEDRCIKITKGMKQERYLQEAVINPIAKIFIDCDMYSTEQLLLDDLMVTKTIYKDFKIYFVNPIGTQYYLAEVLGISSVYGNKYHLTQQEIYNKDLDLIYSDDLNFLRFIDRMLYLEFYHNIGMPEIIHKDRFDVAFSEELSNKKLLAPVGGLNIKLRDTLIADLDYMAIKKFFEDKKLDKYVEDIPYYIKLIKR